MRRLLATVAAVVVASLLSVQLAGGVRSPHQAAAGARAPEPTPITAPVERRVLRERLTLRGSVRPPAQRALAVTASLGGDVLLVTGHPTRRGMELREGGVAVEVSGRPLLVLAGTVPMYRDIRLGDRGRDVLQLQAALARLGLAPGPANGLTTGATAAAMRRLYAARGYESAAALGGNGDAAPAAGDASPGKEDGGGGNATPGGSGNATPGGSGNATPGGSGNATPGGSEAGAPRTVVAPRSEVAFVRRLPARVAKLRPVGAVPGERAVSLASGDPVIVAEAPLESARPLRRGRTVTLEVGGRRTRGTIEHVRRQAAREQGAPATLRVTIRPRRPLPDRAVGREVAATMTTARSGSPRDGWLVVPLAAVFARADGSSSIVILRGGARRRVSVEAGRSVEGYVPVRPLDGSMKEGERVVLSY